MVKTYITLEIKRGNKTYFSLLIILYIKMKGLKSIPNYYIYRFYHALDWQGFI